MDGDLQHPPSLIPKMINEHSKGYNIVQMVKSNQGNNFDLKSNLSKKIYNKIISNYKSCIDYK